MTYGPFSTFKLLGKHSNSSTASQAGQVSNLLKAVSKCREGVPRKVPKACQKASRGLSAGWQLATFGLHRGMARLCQMPPARHIPTLFGPIFRSSFSQKLRLIVCSPASNATRNWDGIRGRGGLLNLALNGSYLWKNPSVEGLISRYPWERVLISNCPLQRAAVKGGLIWNCPCERVLIWHDGAPPVQTGPELGRHCTTIWSWLHHHCSCILSLAWLHHQPHLGSKGI